MQLARCAPSPQRGEGWGEGHAESERDVVLASRPLSNLTPFSSLEDFARASALPKRALILLADADAFRSLGLDRRAALWAVRRLPDDIPLPLFTASLAREQPDERAAPLPAMPLPEHVVADYQTIRLSIKGHPMEFLRPMFAAEGILSCSAATELRDGRTTRCAGVVLVRQRPGTAKGTVFMTIEDETGIANIVVWPKKMAQYRKEVMGARLILIEGRVQKSVEGVTHIVAERLIDRTFEMSRLSDGSLAPTKALPAPPALIELVEGDEVHPRYDRARVPRPRHPRNVRILPPSRDFH
jgi:error-prone DNA polymerase